MMEEADFQETILGQIVWFSDPTAFQIIRAEALLFLFVGNSRKCSNNETRTLIPSAFNADPLATMQKTSLLYDTPVFLF